MKKFYQLILLLPILLAVLSCPLHAQEDPTVDIFIKSYHKDFKWLLYCLKSIEKYVHNIHEIIIVIPAKDARLFDLPLPEKARLCIVKEKGNGYLYQQYVKLTAHRYSQADYIMFVDSDCVFTRDIDLFDFVRGGKPLILMTKYSDLKDPNVNAWKMATEKALGRKVEYEFMRRNFLLYKRSTLANFQAWFPHNLKKYILGQGAFSEFNVIGAYAYFYESDGYHFVNTRDWIFDQPFGKQYWSNSGLTEREKAELDSYVTPSADSN